MSINDSIPDWYYQPPDRSMVSQQANVAYNPNINGYWNPVNPNYAPSGPVWVNHTTHTAPAMQQNTTYPGYGTFTTGGTGLLDGWWRDHYTSSHQHMSNIVPVDDKFIVLKGDYFVKAHETARPLLDWLNDCKYVKYIRSGTEVVILRAVWDAIFTFMKGEVPYAELKLPEFLDKMFAPNLESATCIEKTAG